MTDLRPDIALPFAVFGSPATVTVPGEEPVVTTAVWLGGTTLALLRSVIPNITRGTKIEVAAQDGGAVRSWTVEEILDKPEITMQASGAYMQLRSAQALEDVRVIVIPDAPESV